MKEIKNIIRDYNIQTSKAKSERASIIQEFVEEINLERKDTKWKAIKPVVVAVKLSHLKTNELYPFLSQCRDYKIRKGSFSKCFFGCLKLSPNNPQK